jgi:hypothetical protein
VWSFAAVRTTVVAGRVLVVGLYSNLDGDNACLVHDAVTGDPLGALPIDDDWVYTTPERRLAVMDSHAIVLTRRSAFLVVRLTHAGPEPVGWRTPASHADAVVLGRVGRRAALFATEGDTVTTYGLPVGTRLGPEWTVPPGWRIGDLVRSGRRVYAWLGDGDDRCWLWDVGAALPVGPPAPIRGLRWGPWDLGGRPALLHQAWRRYEVRDLTLGTSIGPPLPVAAHELSVPCVGTVHGRRVLAAATGHRVRVWDLPTGRLVHSGQSPEPPLALALHDGGLVMVERQARVHAVPISPRSAHPLTAAKTS